MPEKKWKPTDGDFEKTVDSQEAIALNSVFKQHDINKRLIGAVHALFEKDPEPDDFAGLYAAFQAADNLSTEAKRAKTQEDRQSKSLDFSSAITKAQSDFKEKR